MPLNQEAINKDIASKQQSETLMQILKDCTALVDMSRRRMSQFYDGWDHAAAVFKGYKELDRDDRDARERKEPEKMVVPISYSQVMTFVAFCYSLFTQRERIFELLGVSAEDHRAAKIAEALLARDLTKNNFDERLYQFLTDIGRFGLGVYKVFWVKETMRVKETVSEPRFSIFGMGLGQVTREVEKEGIKYLGNKIINVSPYRFYPDTRLPLSRFQEGEFCASEDEYTIVQLKSMEKDGLVFGIDHVKPMTQDELKERVGTRLNQDSISTYSRRGHPGSGGQSKGVTVVTEIERVIIPKDYLIDGKPLGPEDYPVKYLVWYANDNRIIRLVPLNYAHDEFTYTIGQYNPDQHEFLGMSLAESIDMLQSVISWFINSHISSVRRVIGDRLVVDVSQFEMSDLKERRSVIRTKPGAAPGGIDRYIKQLDITDVTQNHMSDQEILQRIVQIVTGISESMLGQFHGGRRSATESRNSFSGAANRLKMTASIIFRSGLEPLARQMLSNLREGLDAQTLVRVVGINDAVEGGENFLSVSKTDLAGAYDFEVFDGTLPSEKVYSAEAIGDVLKALISAPQAAIALQLDPKLLLREWLELRGIRNPERFALLVPPQPQNITPLDNEAQSGQPGPGGAAPGVPPVEGESILSLLGGSNQPTAGSSGPGVAATS